MTGSAAVLRALPPPKPEVLILFDGPHDQGAKSHLHAFFIENLLGHFGMRADVVPVDAYRPGRLASYRTGFYIGNQANTELPAALISDVRLFPGPFCWLGRHFDQLLHGKAADWGLRYAGFREEPGFTTVSYKGIALPKEETEFNLVEVTGPGLVDVRATFLDRRGTTHPYALRRGKFWYFADTVFGYMEEGRHFLVFCDLLHDILEQNHAEDSRALVRLEDVSVDDELDDLRHIADLLAARRVPFQFALIPIYRNPAEQVEVRLSDRRSFVDALQYMIAHGGTPVLHGITHQYRGLSADDYEFWDEEGGRPVLGDSADQVLRKVELGLSECFAQRIYPVAFETPHYAASEVDYRALSGVFQVSYDRTMSAPVESAQQIFPYPLVDRFGRRVIPENLGYLPLQNPDPKVIVENARRLKVVRDGIASFYFHPFLDARLLEEAVRGITALGYHFVSLRDFGPAVDFQRRYVVKTVSGPAQIAPQGEYWRMRVFDGGGNLTKEQVSENKRSGVVTVALQIPPGGWAALECMQELPAGARPPGVWDRLQTWWNQVTSRRPVAGNADLTAGRKALLVSMESAPVADRNNQESYRAVLETLRYQVATVRAGDLAHAPTDPETVLVIPHGAGTRFTDAQNREVLRYLKAGGAVVADGRQVWLEALGFRWEGRRIKVAAVHDLMYPTAFEWQESEAVERFTPPRSIRQLMADDESGQALAVAGVYGRGRYLHLAVPLDQHTSDGVSHYPYFPHYLAQTFGESTALRRPHLEVYCDPSYRQGADLNRLAAFWSQSGISTVYVAAWHFTRGFSYPYEEFIKACHRQGIAVYAWISLPATTEKMWDEHPEWRERTAAGGDGRVGWRYSMNLENPACFRAAMDWMEGLLQDYDWDGVNIAELNYDADLDNYLRADQFIPMNEDVRRDFRRRAGFDPLLLFQPASPYFHKRNRNALEQFLRFREEIVLKWHQRVLERLEPLQRKRSWEVIVTAIDSLHSPFVRPALGIDSRAIVRLMRDFDFTLQVEDPAHFWAQAPGRYRTFARTYSKLAPDTHRIMFDVNVVTDRDVSGTTLPSATATGTELARTLEAAASLSGRAAIYAEHTVPPQDWELLKIALAPPARVEGGQDGLTVETPASVLARAARKHGYLMDGRLWPAVSPAGITVPRGRHRISLDRSWLRRLDIPTLPLRILAFSGELLNCELSATGAVVQYRSPGRALLLLNEKPIGTLLDGEQASLPLIDAGYNRWAVAVPAGHHGLSVVTHTGAGAFVSIWGWASASAISAFGIVVTVLMIALYLRVRLRRLRGRT